MSQTNRKCDRCKVNDASVHISKNVNGEHTELYLCHNCAKQGGYTSSGSVFDPLSFDSLFGNIFFPQSIAGTSSCPVCGSTISDIKHSGRFGCSACYDNFESRIDLTPFTSKTGYKGKRPEHLPEEKAQKKTSQDEQNTPSEEELLRAELKKAVEQEDYETAAKLRDKIKALKGEEK